ncbi:MAG: hypothetical protein H7Y20_05085 [Bryobacteraceae bacterium]|nr:hypothetical protein [Bryobacteraceae bacterium]
MSDQKYDWNDEARGLNEGHGDIMAALVKHYNILAKGQGGTIPMNSPGNLDLFMGSGTSHNGYRKFTFNMNPSLGKTIRLRFQSVNTSAYMMLFYVYDVGLTYKAQGYAQ